MMAGGAISWFSRVQKVTAAAASSESEYVALAEMVNELRFLRQVKEFMTPSNRRRHRRYTRITKARSRWRKIASAADERGT